MNTTLYVSKAGEQIYSDAKHEARRHGVSLSIFVETLLDLATDPKADKTFRSTWWAAMRRAKLASYTRSNGAVVSKRPEKTVVRDRPSKKVVR